MSHPYDKIVEAFSRAFAEIESIGLGEVLAKGGVGAILLAHRLGHTLVAGDKGPDARDSVGDRFEYKVSSTNQFNFHFGTRELSDPPEDKVRRHFRGLRGAYCATRKGEKIDQVLFVPGVHLVDNLVVHFKRTKGLQLNKNFSFQSLLLITDAYIVS